jgi:DNA-binding NtrC family response regulator
MIEHILKHYSYTRFPIAPSVISLLQEYSWPGNIRELRNMLERALLLSQGEELSTAHFPGLKPCETIEEVPKMIWNLEELEFSHIQKALTHFNGDKYETSTALGISLSSLYRKLEKIQNETS